MPKAYTENDMNLALWDLDASTYPCIKTSAAAFNVPKSTLHMRYHGQRPRDEIKPPGRRLSLLEEEAVVERVLNDSNCGIPPMKAYV